MTRLDAALVRAGLVRSRAQAKALLDQGRVLVDGAVVSKAAHAVTDDASLELVGEVDPWVGRAAHKLLAALEAFPEIVVAGRRALDVGASTGGFTQVLLTRGPRPSARSTSATASSWPRSRTTHGWTSAAGSTCATSSRTSSVGRSSCS
ncbi:hypothetical protein GCM10025862_10330 [Arsenicicoccus piscis]|uniref:RNA-binding S4 domain-containing protein n=1 Tax=Arsenicicoccus piscis TaxID=673954 RepID=A0ABQ6HLI2_9MICO|nr:SAM-dependent methyltransferase [Arsenicicoccus piscis]GMA19012.1 hypothetical protein GCM10025862_10330 [Arsenicicoccus piscis]